MGDERRVLSSISNGDGQGTTSAPVPPNGAEPRGTASDQSSPTPWKGRRFACEAAAAVILVQLCPPCVATPTPTVLPVLPVVAFEVSDKLSKGLPLSRSVWIYSVNVLASLMRVWLFIPVYAQRTCLGMLVSPIYLRAKT